MYMNRLLLGSLQTIDFLVVSYLLPMPWFSWLAYLISPMVYSSDNTGASGLAGNSEKRYRIPISTGFYADHLDDSTKIVAKDECKPASWMQCFSDWSLLDIPIIPGTHHSGVICAEDSNTRTVFDWARCQSIGIEEQLLAGVRFFDLRVRVNIYSHKVVLSHSMNSDTSLDDALSAVTNFLKNHPTEGVILYIRFDPAFAWYDTEKEILTDHLRKYSESIFPASISNDKVELSNMLQDLTVDHIRGKMVIVSRETTIDREVVHFLPDVVLQYCDTWRCASVSEIKEKVGKHMSSLDQRAVSGDNHFFGGVALDGPFPLHPKIVTSPGLNQWFIDNLASNPVWQSGIRDHGFGILLVDYADEDLIRFFIDTNLSIKHQRGNHVN